MAKEHEYKGKIIKNIPYKSESRWFIHEKDGTRTMMTENTAYSPYKTLKDAKEKIDNIIGLNY